VAQHSATVQLGYRTEQDATLALRRQVPMQRFTPLDRLIVARTQPLGGISGDLRVTADPTRSGLGRFAVVREQSLASRLMTLQPWDWPDRTASISGRFDAIWRPL
jgi:hypothetical protein